MMDPSRTGVLPIVTSLGDRNRTESWGSTLRRLGKCGGRLSDEVAPAEFLLDQLLIKQKAALGETEVETDYLCLYQACCGRWLEDEK